jgi:hypothetical protein
MLATAIAAVALGPRPSAAQTPAGNPNVDLLQPSLDGNPTLPPRFRPPGDTATPVGDAPLDTGTFELPPIGTMPVYGSPTGFGAGDTGFDSSNTPRSKRLAQQAPNNGSVLAPAPETTFSPVPSLPSEPPSTPPAPPPQVAPEVHPARAASRPGAVLPGLIEPLPISNPPPVVYPAAAADRPGAVLPMPPPLDVEASGSLPPPGTPPINTLPLGTPSAGLPIAAGDPYEALGIKAGSFLILPAVEFSAGYDGNPQHVPGGGASSYLVAAPELHVRSLWATNSLSADIVGSYYDYGETFTPSLDRPYLNSKIDGALDVTRDTQIVLENRVIVSTDNPGSPNITAGLASLPIDTTVGGTLGVIQTFNRLSVSLKGTFDRSVYQDSELTNGETASNADRDFDQYAGILRVAYEFDPDFKPFVEVDEDTRIHDLQFDSNGFDRDSDGTSAVVGADVNLFGSLTGEMALGYLQWVYRDPALPDIGGVIANGSLLWQATGLTSAKLSASSSVSESVLPGVSGEFSRDVNLEVDHALRRWLIATGTIGYGNDDYVGEPRIDNRYFVSGGLTYKFNPMMQLKGVMRYDWLTSSASGVAYNAASFLLTLRLQR